MAWRDKLRPASFRGAGFFVESHNTESGRRLAVHTYPKRDLPYAEDMGRKAREFSMEAYVLGPDYMAARDALLAACEEAGPGQLVHPYLGTVQVTCNGCGSRERAGDGGMATFSLRFIEAGKRNYPAQEIDFTAQVATDADAARAVAGDVFRAVYDTAGPAWLAAAAAGDVESALELINTVAKSMPNPLDMAAVGAFLDKLDKAAAMVNAALTGDPGKLGELIDGIVGDLAGVTGAEALAEVAKFGEELGSQAASLFGGALPAIVTSTANLAKQATARDAFTSLVRELSSAHGVEAALNKGYEAFQDAMGARDLVLGALDGALLKTKSDQSYQALQQLYSTAAAGFVKLGAVLPNLNTYTPPPAATPALALAYDLYGDLDRADELAKRNKIRNPGYLPAGDKLWVLDA